MNEEGGDDSPSRPKRKIKKVMILSSSSDSDSEESIGVTRTRRKKLRVVSENESSDSSGSSVVCGTRRRRTLPKLRDSEAESDTSGWASDRSNSKQVASTSKAPSGFASDSSEGNSDKCSICLLRFKNQEIGTPINCEHIFCLDCITEWSKNVNTCPVDRITFESIVVKACIGGRVLRTEPVKVIERRPSVDILVVEETIVCEICSRGDDEESMLLCDGCDLGYHMQCLTPPLTEVPASQWLCPSCDDIYDAINLSEVEDLFSDIADISRPLGPRPAPLRAPRNVRRSARTQSNPDQPSTSSGRRGSRLSIEDIPTSSRGFSTTNRNRSTTTGTQRKRKRTTRRRTRKVLIEYEIQENGKFPVTRSVTRTVRRRKTRKRQPRTAARRSHVRASVRAMLTSMKVDQEIGQSSNPRGVQDLRVSRQRAGIPTLSIYGNTNQLEYFSDDEVDVSEGASTAVAIRPTSSILSAYRQARRKMINIPSPTHASSAPDLLSNILESQALLHSKNSIVSVSVDGNVNIKLQRTKTLPSNKSPERAQKEKKLDLTKTEEAVREVPSYPGQSRGGGGWGGGYRGTYHRDQNNFNRGNYDNNYGNSYQNRQGSNNMYNNYQNNNNMRRDSEPEFFDNYRRSHQFSHADDSYFDRTRRNAPNDANRPQNFSNTPRPNEQNQGRYSLGPPWQPYGNAPPASRQDMPPAAARHSFGGFENPLDMRMGQMPPRTSNIDSFSRVETPQQEKPQPQLYNPPVETQSFEPLPQPPMFNFPKSGELEKSEDEKSDSGLVIDTEKYDPTDPTNDDDSGDEHKDLPEPSTASVPRVAEIPVTAPAVAVPLPPEPAPAPPRTVQSILAGIDTSSMNVPANVLDSAVRQVLKEHRNLIVPATDTHNDKSDEDSEGDCPNFSIYSATSVHIANNTSILNDDVVPEEPHQDGLEDLVQEDDDVPDIPSPAKSDNASDETIKAETTLNNNKSSTPTSYETNVMSKTEEEYKEKISKRCPITTNTRNPIKIKINTPSLIKRVSLYDEEDTNQDVNPTESDVIEDKMESENPASPKLSKEHEKLFEENEVTSTICKQNKEVKVDVNNVKDNVDQEFDEKIKLCEEIKKSDETVNKKDEDMEVEKEKDFQDGNKSDKSHSEHDNEMSDTEICFNTQSPKDEKNNEKGEENVEKMTESISETEDERSYTPCLDENKPKDASFEIDKDKGLEGLDTEMISEEEGNEMFSENERPSSAQSHKSPPRAKPVEEPPPEVAEKKRSDKKKGDSREDGKKKKKKESKKEAKEKSKSKKKTEISFKKLSKSGKERNYRERDRDDKKKKDRRSSSEAPEVKKKRKEKRKDLERYDVRTLVTEKRRKVKDPFGRDVSPRARSPSLSPRRSASPEPRAAARRRSPARARRTASRGRRSVSRARRSLSRARRSLSRARRSISRAHASPRARRTPSRPHRSPARRSVSRLTPVALRESPRARRSPARRPRRSPSARSPSPRRSVQRKRRRRSASRARRRRSASGVARVLGKKKKRARPDRSPTPPRRRVVESPRRKIRRSASLELSPARSMPSPSLDSQPPSPRTPPPEPPEEPPLRVAAERARRRELERPRRRARDAPGPSKEVFTSGDNILVSVSFKDQQRGEEEERRRRRESKRDRRRRRRNPPPPEAETAKPVAIIDLDRSPFRELTPSPKNVIVLSDSEPGEKDAAEAPAAAPAPAPALAPAEPHAAGPKTPPEPSAEGGGPPVAAVAAVPAPAAGSPGAGAEPRSPDAYDPFEPTRSASASPASGRSGASPASAASAPSPAGPPPDPPRLMTLESAQRTNMSADDVLDRRPVTPAEKVLALLQSTRDASPEPPPGDEAGGGAAGPGAPAGGPGAPAGGAGACPGAPGEEAPPPLPRIVLPSPGRAPPKLFPGKPSPIKSNPVKPMARPPSEPGSPYSPGSSDFGDLFEPPARRRRALAPAANAHNAYKKKGKTQVGVKIDEDNLKILDDLPSSAVEMQVKSKFLKKLNRQERVVEEVKLVLKPHYNKKHITKDEYKQIMRRAVPKICHNKTGEINPAKIQSLVEAYVKKFRKRRKLGLA
ncbi:unnamed protein product [Colias eurytheme]|nr:unnamed protein product [Colias eurytheme]